MNSLRLRGRAFPSLAQLSPTPGSKSPRCWVSACPDSRGCLGHFNQSQARRFSSSRRSTRNNNTSTIIREGIDELDLTTTTTTTTGTGTNTRRSLSEHYNSSFLVIRRNRALDAFCFRLYSTTSSSPSSSLSSSSPPGCPTEPDSEAATGEDAIREEEADYFILLAECDSVDPEMLVLKPDLEATGGIPPLPAILNEALRAQVFTHRSVYGRSKHEFEDHPDDPSPDYEVLEFQGDAALGLVVTDLVRDCYPRLRVGPLSKIKAMVVANANLADISGKYGLPQNLRVNKGSAMSLKSSLNVQADIFEAYVGGLYKDQGLEVVRKWLTALFLPYVKEAYRVCRDQHGLPSPPPSPSRDLPHVPYEQPSETVPPNHSESSSHLPQANQNGQATGHLALFNQYLQQKHMTVEWKFEEVKDVGTKVTPIWAVQAIVEGHQVAVGRGNTKKAAQSEAAREALVQLGITTTLD